MNLTCRIAIVALALSPAAALAQEGLEKNLRARVAVGDFHFPASCLQQSSVLRALERVPDSVPGAPRFVVAAGPSGWNVAGMDEMLALTGAGLYAMTETKLRTKEGKESAAREFRLTPRGSELMVRADPYCFKSTTPVVQLVAATPVAAPEGLARAGQAYLVKFKVRQEPAAWTRAPALEKFFGPAADAREPALQERVMILANGRWLAEWEAALGMARSPAFAANSVESQAARLAALTPSAIRARLSEAKYRERLDPCFQLPMSGMDFSRHPRNANEALGFAFHDEPVRRDTSLRDAALEFLRRLEKAGLAKGERFDGEAFAGAPKAKGMRYVLNSEASSAIDLSRGLCLPLGEAKLDSLWLGEPEAQQSEVRRAIFHGWAHLERPRPYVAALASQFPNVRSVIENGYGISGRIQGREGYAMEVQTYVPEFKPKS